MTSHTDARKVDDTKAVLIVEDETSIRDVLVELFEIEGNVVNVECHAGHWVAFVEGFDGEQLRTSGPFRFHYYRRGHDQ